jgi:putative radical SAM enzyme (TIGR03279 family)
LLKISAVHPGSIAERAGIRAGDEVMSINGHELRDVIDYQFYSAEDRLSLVVRRPGMRTRRLVLSRTPDAGLGISLQPFAVRRCRNNCIFCFVDQMPKGCRKSLYIKDDDYRASFLFGNFITLGNLRDEDWERIFAQRLSPLYLSVHATDPALRAALLRNGKAPDILKMIDRLAAGGIRMHAQIVLCPGINDGAHLKRTVEDLSTFHPAVQSIAAVPAGLTAFRKGLFPLRSYRRNEALKVVQMLEGMGKVYRTRLGSRLVFASDEFYIKAGLPVPSASFYEDFPQIENGVGMVATFLRDARRTRLPRSFIPRRVTVITGESFGPMLKRTIERVNRIPGADVRVLIATNRFFGASVTVSGLLTGRDMLHAVAGKKIGSLLVIPDNVLKEDEPVFLDGTSLKDLQHAVGVPVRRAAGFRDLIRLLRMPNPNREEGVQS